jgi:hypothetical protein
MEHEDAIKTNAVERYLLDQMVEDERAIFEEHYFDCRVCAADITDGTRMMVVGQAVVKGEPPIVVPFRRWFEWAPVAAAASLVFGLLGTGIGYRVAQVQYRPATELVQPPIQIDTAVFRAGTVEEVPVVRAGDEVKFDVQPDNDAASYDAAIVCGEKIQSRHGISREMAADAITLRLGELPLGRCELVIEGVRKDGNRFEITESPFEVGGREGVR